MYLKCGRCSTFSKYLHSKLVYYYYMYKNDVKSTKTILTDKMRKTFVVFTHISFSAWQRWIYLSAMILCLWLNLVISMGYTYMCLLYKNPFLVVFYLVFFFLRNWKGGFLYLINCSSTNRKYLSIAKMLLEHCFFFVSLTKNNFLSCRSNFLIEINWLKSQKLEWNQKNDIFFEQNLINEKYSHFFLIIFNHFLKCKFIIVYCSTQ